MATAQYDSQYQKMTEAPVGRLVLELAIPTVISMLLTAVYNLVDTAFVGRLGTSASGAVGIVYGYMAILQAIGFMFGQGSGSTISILLGKKKTDDASRFASTGFFTSALVGLAITIISLILMNPLLKLLGSTPTILPFARDYCFYIAIGAPFIIASFVLNIILRYEGMAFYGLIGMGIGCFLNMIGDPVLIFGFGLSTAGAGMSTAFSQMVGLAVLLIPFVRGKTQTRINPIRFTLDIKEIGRIISVGFPSMVRQMLSSLSTIFLNHASGVYGDSAIAAMAITGRVAMFLYSIVIGIGQGNDPVCTFNYGAGKYDRVRKAFRDTVIISTILLLVVGVIVFALSSQIIAIFQNDPEVLKIGTNALRFTVFSLVFIPFTINSTMIQQSTGHSLIATFLSLLRSGIIFLPLLAILSHTMGLVGIEMTQPLADVITALICIPFTIIFFRNLAQKEQDVLEDVNGVGPKPQAENR